MDAGPESKARRAVPGLQVMGKGVGGFLGPKLSCTPAAYMVPQRRSDFSQIVLRALITGAFVSLVNACVAGECCAAASEFRPLAFYPLSGSAGS